MNLSYLVPLLMLLTTSLQQKSFSSEFSESPKTQISCTHIQVCNSLQFLLKGLDQYTVKNIVETKHGDPHHFEPSVGDIKLLRRAQVLVLPPIKLQPWLKNIHKKRNGEDHSDKKTILIESKNEHFWLNQKTLCLVLKKLSQDLAKDLTIQQENKLKNNWICQNKTFQSLKKKLQSKDVIILHDALRNQLEELGLQVYSLRGSSHFDKISPKSLKQIAQVTKKSQSVIWIIEEQIHYPHGLLNLIKKDHLKIKINTYGRPETSPESILRELHQKLSEL